MKKREVLLAIMLVFLLNFASAGILKVTEEHPFLVNSEWTPAKNLQVGDMLQTSDGKQVKIKKITWHPEIVSVFNLESDFFHNFILQDGLIVHNSNPPIDESLGYNPSKADGIIARTMHSIRKFFDSRSKAWVSKLGEYLNEKKLPGETPSQTLLRLLKDNDEEVNTNLALYLYGKKLSGTVDTDTKEYYQMSSKREAHLLSVQEKRTGALATYGIAKTELSNYAAGKLGISPDSIYELGFQSGRGITDGDIFTSVTELVKIAEREGKKLVALVEPRNARRQFRLWGAEFDENGNLKSANGFRDITDIINYPKADNLKGTFEGVPVEANIGNLVIEIDPFKLCGNKRWEGVMVQRNEGLKKS